MDSKPTIYLTNWSSRKLHGPGRAYTIMARPRHWEHGDGVVRDLVPDPDQLTQVRGQFVSFAAYKAQCIEKFSSGRLSPGDLMAFARDASAWPRMWPVADGDTLCCACSRMNAAEDRCHRVWAAVLLSRNGWRVVLDGEALT